MYRPMRTLSFLALFLWLSLYGLALADTHWVNPAGSNVSPYTSYATAAHKIQDAIDQSTAGDTVRISAGVHYTDTTVFLRDSIIVMGAGRDSTVITPGYEIVSYGLNPILKLLGPSGGAGGGLTLTGCTISGYTGFGGNYPDRYGIMLGLKKTTTNYIYDNRFYYCWTGVDLGYADVVVANNVFDSNAVAVAITFGGPYDIHHNEIWGWPLGGGEPAASGISSVGMPLLGPARIHNNVIFLHNGSGIGSTNTGDSIFVYNNLIVTGGYRGLFAYCACSGVVIHNNTVIRTTLEPDWPIAGFTSAPGSEIVLENNVFWGADGIVSMYGPPEGGGAVRFAYNDLWGLDAGSDGAGLDYPMDIVPDTVGNLNRNPMFVDDSTYHLQRGSPLIDAGNPELIDLDLTRSDIGWTGGMWGLLYNDYPELPPRRPDTLLGEASGETVLLSWPVNTEADLAEYRLYRDTYSGFIPDDMNLRKTVNCTDTSCVDVIEEGSGDVYYQLTALDTTGLESVPSNEIAVFSTGVFEEDTQGDDSVSEAPSLTAYPNPFNSTTTIRFVVPQIAGQECHVKIDIYDVLGNRISVLLDDKVTSGIHTISWPGTDHSGRRLASGIYFASMRISGVERTTSTKLLILK